MQRSTFKVLFYVKRQSEKSGQVPVMGRITINGTMSQFSCKLTVRSSLWDAKANKAAGRSLESQRINENLENIKTNIGKQYQRLCDRDSYVTAEKVRNAFLGMGDDCRLLLQTFDEYLAGFLKRVGKDRAYSSYDNYRKRRNRLASFLEYEYHVKDIAFKELKREFVEKFVVYLSTVKGLASGTIHSTLKKLKLMTYTAYKNGWIAVDPFAGFYVKAEYAERRYLSASELQAVMDVRLPNYRTGINRDAFVFCAFTGLSHSDVAKLKRTDIKDGFFDVVTQKTHDGLRIELNDHAQAILDKYKNDNIKGDLALPVISNVKMNAQLKVMGQVCGIDEPTRIVYFQGHERHEQVFPKWALLTTHCGRRTFVVTALQLGIPSEVIMKWTGHSDMKAMKPYMAIVDELKAKAMERFNKL